MADLALGPVSVGLATLLNVTALTSLTGLSEDVPQGTPAPFTWYEVREEEGRGLGDGGMPTVQVRVRTFSTKETWAEAQTIQAVAIGLLKDQRITVSGYTHCGRIFYDDTVQIPETVIGGVKGREIVSNFRVIVEEA